MFIVAWTKIEGKFAIPCHSGKTQRQRSSSQEQMGTPVPDGSHCLCHGAEESQTAIDPFLGPGWLGDQRKEPLGKPLNSSVRCRAGKGPESSLHNPACMGQGQPASQRQAIGRC